MRRLLTFAIVLSLGFLLGSLGYAISNQAHNSLQPVQWSPEARWIAAAQKSYRLYARNTFLLTGQPHNGWLRISADNDFVVYVNGRKILEENNALAGGTQGVVQSLSDKFQRLNDRVPYRTVSTPEILRAGPKDWRITAYVDLVPYLQPGQNAIAVRVQEGALAPRFVLEGAATSAAQTAVDLTTGNGHWRVATIGKIHQQTQWYESDFPDLDWPRATAIGSVQAKTYSRLSPQLYQRSFASEWISGVESAQGEVWLRGIWDVSAASTRAFLRFAGASNYSILLNGQFIRNYSDAGRSQAHMYEVGDRLRNGSNIIAVRLARPLNQQQTDGQNTPLMFALDGWTETTAGEICSSITTNSHWQFVNQPSSSWFKAMQEGQPALLLGAVNPSEILRTYEGSVSNLNYPDKIRTVGLWQLGACIVSLVLAWSLGKQWALQPRNFWNCLDQGAILLLPGTVFLITMELVKERFAQTDLGILLFQPQSNTAILLAFIGYLLVELLGYDGDYHQRHKHTRKLLNLFVFRWTIYFLLGAVAFTALLLSEELFLALPVNEILRGVLIVVLSSSIGIFAQLVIEANSHHENVAQYIHCWLNKDWVIYLALLIVIAVALGLRFYKYGAIDLSFDENVSLDAARGILKTGAPIASSGIWYTRSPVYHYLLAIFLAVFGDAIWAARLLSTLAGALTILVVFLLAYEITSNRWIALVVAVALSMNPWEIMLSRAIRFYQLVQCFGVLSFWLFIKAFIKHQSPVYQYAFFVALTFAVLSQELAVTLFPVFFLGFIIFYPTFKWSNDWKIMLGVTLTVAITGFNLAFFSLKTMTPWVSLSTTTDSITKFNLYEFTAFFTNFFAGFNSNHLIYSFFFFAGFFYFLFKRNGMLVYLFGSVFLNLLIITVLVRQVGARYTYIIYPLLIILSVYSAIQITYELIRKIAKELFPLFWVRVTIFCLLLVMLVSNLDFLKVLEGYHQSTYKRHSEVLNYYLEHREVDDILVSATPSPMANIVGQLDYYLMPALNSSTFPFDSVYWRNGQVIDRWSGGVIVTNVDQMKRVLENAKNRVWIHEDDEKLEGLRSKDPEFSDYLRTIGRPVKETFGTRMRLWQPSDGLLYRLPNEGKDIGSY